MMSERPKIFFYTGIIIILGFSLYFLLIFDLLESFFLIVSFLMLVLAIAQYFFGNPVASQVNSNKNTEDFPFVSIHLAICNEPPEMVINTLRTALKVDYPNYEIIVLDNNTSKKSLWEPVRDFCDHHSEVIKFLHFDHLSGYKAGALNECLHLTDENAKYILTLDADYQLLPNSLNLAVNGFQGDNLAVLQFPQHYENNRSQSGLLRELEHFFRLYANSGNKTLSTLPTGTLSFIKRDALLEVGGWPEETLTEDARLGLEFLRKDYRLKYSSHRIGKGIMPYSISDLRKQRNRWSYGNAQCVSALFDMRMNWKCRISACLQLLSWINLLAIPILGSFLLIGLTLFDSPTDYGNTGSLILLQFGIYVTGKFFLLLKGSNRKTVSSDIKAYFIHLGLSCEMAFACWSAFFKVPQSFIRTSKTKSRTQYFSIPVLIPLILGLLMSLFFYQEEYYKAMVSLGLFALFLISSLYMFFEFQPVTKSIQPKLKTLTS
ncbi:glycosyltransferase [Gramella sp. BOM4]|nr:glycosyltransferase [Christiangramia bathymodioli]